MPDGARGPGGILSQSVIMNMMWPTGPDRACRIPRRGTCDEPALPGCVWEGETLDEVLANIREAAEGWLEVNEIINT